jgi:hypothetical protein
MFAVRQWSTGKEESIHDRETSNEEPLSYIELRSGEDVSINGADTLYFSGNAGGLALMLRLQFTVV